MWYNIYAIKRRKRHEVSYTSPESDEHLYQILTAYMLY